MSKNPIDFKWRHFNVDLILKCVRWYCKYGIGYRDLEEMMAERGLAIDHTTVYRWVQHYAPELKKRIDWRCVVQKIDKIYYCFPIIKAN
ncbi:transposase [Legionella oakridgensis]|nr:transposase [Legionella oakridgensis]